MRHAKHRHTLGVKKEHRLALMANLASALLYHGQIRTTLTKAKALRPFVEKIITLAKKASRVEDPAKKLHYRRLAFARVRDVEVVNELFEEKVQEFLNRNGGYTRIYKLVPRIGDAADMAIIELIDADDEGYGKKRKKKASKQANVAGSSDEQTPESEEDETKAEAVPPEQADGEAKAEESSVEDVKEEPEAEEQPEGEKAAEEEKTDKS